MPLRKFCRKTRFLQRIIAPWQSPLYNPTTHETFCCCHDTVNPPVPSQHEVDTRWRRQGYHHCRSVWHAGGSYFFCCWCRSHRRCISTLTEPRQNASMRSCRRTHLLSVRFLRFSFSSALLIKVIMLFTAEWLLSVNLGSYHIPMRTFTNWVCVLLAMCT